MERRTTTMATTNPPWSIADLYHSCIAAFEQIAASLDSLASESFDSTNHGVKEASPDLVLQEQIGRLRVWAGNVGAHRVGRMSLDYKLSEASNIHKAVSDLLKELNDSLLEMLSSTQRNPPLTANETGEEGGDDENTDNIAPSEDEHNSDIDSASTTSGDSASESLQSDLLFILDDISHIISCLYNLSVAMHQPALQDRLHKYAEIDLSHYEFFDNQHVLEKFPDTKSFLIKRLGNANTQRRQYFKYRLLHHKKISKGVEDVGVERPMAKPLTYPEDEDRGIAAVAVAEMHMHAQLNPFTTERESNPGATNHDYNIHNTAATITTAIQTLTTISIVPRSATPAKSMFDNIEAESDGGQTATSFGTITEAAQVKQLKVPDPPNAKHVFAGNAFQCPYCYSLIIVKTSKAWQRHVFKDLRPYVCTFESCTKPTRLFETRHDWYDHELRHHRCEWYCAVCEFAYPNISKFTFHLKATHPALLGDDQEVPALIGNCQRALNTPQSCPLCKLDSGYTSQRLRSHLSRHMQQLALFTLPRLELEENAGEDIHSVEPLGGSREDESSDEEADENMTQLDFDSSPPRTASLQEDEAQEAAEGTEGAAASEAIVQLPLQSADTGVDSVPGESALLFAAEKGHEAVVQALLEQRDVDVNAKDNDGKSPLSRAAENGHERVVQLLLDRDDVDADAKDKSGKSPLSRAAARGHEAVVRLLLGREDLDVNAKDNYGRSPLSWAAAEGHEAVVQLLLERADVDAKDNYGKSPLLWATQNGHEAIVRLLLEQADVDVNAKDRVLGCTALLRAAEKGHEAIVRLLLKHADVDVNAKGKGGKSLLELAVEKGHEAVVRLLLEREDVDVDAQHGSWLLLLAAYKGHEGVVRLLLNRPDVNVNTKDNDGRSPLSWAAGTGHDAVVRLLLKREDVDVNAKDNNDRSPLLWAVETGHDAVVRLLLEREDVDVDAQHGRWLLLLAAYKGHEGVVRLLLDRPDVNVNTKDNDDRSPLSWAAGTGHDAVVRLLLEREDVDVNAKDNDDRSPLLWAVETGHDAVVRLLLEREDVDVDAQHGSWLLLLAAYKGHEGVVRLLLDRPDVNVNTKDNDDRSPLSWAAGTGHDAVVRLLLERPDVDVNAKDNYGQSPLSRAAQNGHEAIVRLLLERADVDVNARGHDGESPLSCAEANGHTGVVSLLTADARLVPTHTRM